jgi:predicted DCC family thiol-disulfide oxidoreductase YuxK
MDQGPDVRESHPILLYDGVCGLCNRGVQFVLRRDLEGRFRFAALQSGLAARVLARHGAPANDLDSVYVVIDYEMPGERLVGRSDAVAFVLQELGAKLRSDGQTGASVPTKARRGLWRTLGFVLQAVPRGIRDWGYGVVARRRYRIFGRYDQCPVASAETRERFLDS